jgi:hypothetical protein
MGRPMSAPETDEVRREETLAALPGLLSLARQVIITSFQPGDPESDALKALLDECVVGAHRIYLRERLGASLGLESEGG